MDLQVSEVRIVVQVENLTAWTSLAWCNRSYQTLQRWRRNHNKMWLLCQAELLNKKTYFFFVLKIWFYFCPMFGSPLHLHPPTALLVTLEHFTQVCLFSKLTESFILRQLDITIMWLVLFMPVWHSGLFFSFRTNTERHNTHLHW